MGQNKIQAFATDSSANVLTDEALATRSEMQTGFPTGSKANSALVGKLIQNATAGAYAVAEFTAKNSDSDISGNDPTGFATAFENTIKELASASVDLSNYTGDVILSKTQSVTVEEFNISATTSINNTDVLSTLGVSGIKLSTDYNIGEGSYTTTYKSDIQLNFASAYLSLSMGAANASDYTFYVGYGGTHDFSNSLYGLACYQGDTNISGVMVDHHDNNIYEGRVKLYTNVDNQTTYIQLNKGIDFQDPNVNGGKRTPLSNFALKTDIPDTSTFATKDEVNAKADSSALANYAPLASPNFTGTATVNGNTIATVNQIPNMAAYVKYVGDAEHNEVLLDTTESNNPEGNKNLRIQVMTSTGEASEAIECAPITKPSFQENAYIDGIAIATEFYVDSLTSTKISLTGNRGVLAGYETTTDVSNAITITSSSPDSQRAPTAIAITVPNGSGEESWVKKVLIQDASSSITLGDLWFWTGGTQPTLTAPSLLVLSWDSVCGIAILNTTA